MPRAYVEINCSPPFIVIFLGCPPRNLRRGQRRRSRRIPSLAHTDLHHDFSTDEKGREEEEEIRAHASTRGARDCRGPGEAGARASSSSPSSWSRANGIARVRFLHLTEQPPRMGSTTPLRMMTTRIDSWTDYSIRSSAPLAFLGHRIPLFLLAVVRAPILFLFLLLLLFQKS